MSQPPGTATASDGPGDPELRAQKGSLEPGPCGDRLEPSRNSNRRGLPDESPGRMVLPDRHSVYVTLQDISSGGCCVVRKGELALKAEDRVCIEIWRENIETKASLPAIVRWVSHQDETTRAGLHFVDSSVKTQRTIDHYLQRSFEPDS